MTFCAILIKMIRVQRPVSQNYTDPIIRLDPDPKHCRKPKDGLIGLEA